MNSMDYAVRVFQMRVFTILLWASGFTGVIADLTSEGSKTIWYLTYDGLTYLLAILSLSYLKGALRVIMIVIIAGIIINLSYSQASIGASLNGLREILMMMSVVCFYNKIFERGNEEEIAEYAEIMKKFISWYLIAQIPVAALQNWKYGPSDFVGGTYGSFNGGAMSIIIVCMILFMFQFPMTAFRRILMVASLTPMFLNETKISFILIPMTIVFIFFEPRIKNILLAAVGGVVFLLIFNQLYTHNAFEFDDNMSGIFSKDFLEDYLMADIYTYSDVPRLTRIIIGWSMLSQETATMLFGFEYGLFRFGAIENASPFVQNYYWLLNGTRPFLFFLMMQGGAVLVTMWLLMMASINRFFRDVNKFIIYYFIIFLLILFYLDSFRHHNFSLVYFFAVFFGNSRLYENKSASL